MWKKAASLIWEKTPYFVRMRVIRATQPKFTVSVAAVITNRENEILLLDHVLRPVCSWGIPGGFVEHGEQPETAIRREILEETGLALRGLRMVRVRTIKRHIEILFRAEADGTAEIKSREISDLGWFDSERLPENLSATQRKIIENVLRPDV